MIRPVAQYLTSAIMLAFTPGIFAAPLGGQVTSGSGNISHSGATTSITQNSQNLSINWDSFNVAASETVNFIQPSASAIAVNRILDTNGSQIFGQINSNGQIFLINPNGILFGQGAQVNVGSMVASTLDISDASIGDAVQTFSGNGVGSINNQGSITATDGGYIALLGNVVTNHGSVTAPLGSVALGAGSAVTLTFAGSSLVKMQVDQSTLDNRAENGGLIRADGGTVLMSAGAKDALLASVVNNTGVIEARTVQNRNGTIILLGGMAAGTTNVGGMLDASAPTGGNGGFIETSAAQVNVANDARITTAATAGMVGSWLIDPVDFIISDSGGNMASTLLSNSLVNNNVTIMSNNGTTGTEGNIIVNGAVSWSNNKLTLNAQNNVFINANLNASGNASLALEYGQGALAAGNTSEYLLTNGAQVNLPAGQNFSTKLGSNGATTLYNVITSLGAVGSITGTDLQGINGGLAGNYVLGADIDATATNVWDLGAGFAPIGTFTGTFDGLGHTISNLTINPIATTDVGLFGNTGTASAIRNIQVGGTVTGVTNVGMLVGNNLGSISYSNATGTVNGTTAVGGLVGNNGGTVTSSNTASVVVGSGTDIGGLAGSNVGTVEFSYATGNISGGGSNLGGLVGNNASTISSSYATGNVTGTGTGANLAGLVGNNAGTISSSYATGLVSDVSTTSTNLAGLVAVDSGTVTNSYWDTVASNQSLSAAGTGLTSAQMQQQANFAGWDFANNWIIYDGITNPLLRTFMVPLTVTANDNTVTYTGLTLGFNGVSYSTTPDAKLLGTVSYGGDALGAVDVGSYVITPGGLYSTQQQGGYAITYVDGSLTVYPAPLSVTGTVVNNKVYDGTTAATFLTNGTLNGVLGTDIVNLTESGEFFSPNADTGVSVQVTNSLSGTKATNYTLADTSILTADITRKGVDVNGTTVSDKIYDGTTQSTLTGGTLSGVIGSDNLTLSQSGVFASQNVGTNLDVTVTDSLVGTVADNYSLNTPSYTLQGNINQRPVTVTGTSANNKVYDSTTAANLSGGTLNGAIGADLANLTLAQSGIFATQNVGNAIDITVTDTLNGTAAGNYILNTPTSILQANITPATLTYTGTPIILDLPYGQEPTGFTGVVTGLAGSDTLANSTTGSVVWSTNANIASGPGQYSIDGDGLSASNYVFTQAVGNTTALTLTRQGNPSPPPPSQDQFLLLQLAQITATQLESNVLSNQSSAQPGDINISGTITTAPDSDTSEESEASPSGQGNEAVKFYAEKGGLVLNIANEGMRLPENRIVDTKGQNE